MWSSEQIGYYYNLLFHDHNPSSRHFEPLLSYSSLNNQRHNINLSCQIVDSEVYGNSQLAMLSFGQFPFQEHQYSSLFSENNCEDSLLNQFAN